MLRKVHVTEHTGTSVRNRFDWQFSLKEILPESPWSNTSARSSAGKIQSGNTRKKWPSLLSDRHDSVFRRTIYHSKFLWSGYWSLTVSRQSEISKKNLCVILKYFQGCTEAGCLDCYTMLWSCLRISVISTLFGKRSIFFAGSEIVWALRSEEGFSTRFPAIAQATSSRSAIEIPAAFRASKWFCC